MSKTIGDWLTESTKLLTQSGIATSRLDCLVLLEDCLGVNRANLLAHPEKTLSQPQQARLESDVARRSTHEPLAYIRSKTEFYGRDFFINHAVLEPRPESETMIEQLKALRIPSPHLLDVGTGSGAIGITAALEIESSQVALIDIDPLALAVAKINCSNYKLSLNCELADLLTKVGDKQYDALLCNLPYVPSNFGINSAAEYEPKIAIYGGEDGLELYRKLFKQAAALSSPPKYILTESLPPQHDNLESIAKLNDYLKLVKDDFIQVFQYQA